MLEIPNLPTLDEMIKENTKIVRKDTNKPLIKKNFYIYGLSIKYT